MDSLPELLLVGLSHRTAPVALREQYAVKPEDLEDCLRSLKGDERVSEAMVTSTCNRTEALVVGEGEEVEAWVRSQVFRNLDAEYVYVYRGVHAVMHLMRVASGLDSLVLGESEILAQTKKAFDSARSAGTLGKVLEALGKQALEAGKRVRTETELGQGTLSVARVAVDVVHHAFGTLEDNRALVVGAGETGLLVAKHLSDEGIAAIDFANRTFSRAEEAAAEFGGEAFLLEQLDEAADRVDILVVCVDGAAGLVSPETLDKKRLARRDGPLLVIDLSVPRAVDPEIAESTGALLYNLDDLEPVVERNRKARGEATAESADILVAEVHKFLSLRTYASFSPAIADLHEGFQEVHEEVLDAVTEGKATPRELELAHEMQKRLLALSLEKMKEGARRSRSAEALSREYDRFLEDQ